MRLLGTILLVVAADAQRGEAHAAVFRKAGAVVRVCTLEAEGPLVAVGEEPSVAVFDVGAEPERFAPAVHQVRDLMGSRRVHVFVLCAPEVSAQRLAALGPIAYLAPEGEPALLDAVAEMTAEPRAVKSGEPLDEDFVERLETAERRLATMRREQSTFVHDARVLCGIVVGYGANLRDAIAGPLAPRQEAHVAHILDAMNDLGVLLERHATARYAPSEAPRRARTSSSPVSRRGPARRKLIELGELARVTTRMFTNVAAQRDITLGVECEAVKAWCDPAHVKQALTNLIVNALKFTPHGGKVDVFVSLVAPHSGDAQGLRKFAQIVVADTGPGIAPGDRERVFERGVRLERDAGVPGSGLGLSVVREIVALHGGSVRAEATPDGGAAFVIELPLDMRARRDRGVVFVEDSARGRELAEALLARPGVELTEGDDARRAALAACGAVVLVPERALDELLTAMQARGEPHGSGGTP